MTSPNYTLGRIEDLGGIDLERLLDANYYLIKGMSYIEAAQNIIKTGLSGLPDEPLDAIADNKPNSETMAKYVYQPLDENIPDD